MPKKKPALTADPFQARESLNYDQPIASREYLLKLINTHKVPISRESIGAALQYQDENQLEALRRRLRAMVRDGQIFRDRCGDYLGFDHVDLEKGLVQAHPDGFGFLQPESGGKDIFLPERQMRKLMNGDRAAVKIVHYDKRRERSEAIVISVLERAHQSVVGCYHHENGIEFIVPDDQRLTQDILINRDHGHSAKTNDIVLLRIQKYPSEHHLAVGIVESIFGQNSAPGMEVTIALNKHQIPHHWNSAVNAEIQTLPAAVAEADRHNRLDLRALPFVTIDGADARDFDDAVYCRPEGNIFRLYVAIADVAHYVKRGSALDEEAINRGTSVYFPGEVVPMLPEILSNGLCSLNPHTDRLCVVCCMEVNQQGLIQSYQFSNAVIHSQARLIYDDVARAIFSTKDGDSTDLSDPVRQNLDHLKQVYQVLAKARRKRHALEFETREVVFRYNAQRKIESIEPVERNQAHLLIEECMIGANICAARLLKKQKILALYRIHGGPNAEKLPALIEFLATFGIKLTTLKPNPSDYAEIIKQAKGKPEFDMIQTFILRSLLQASYSPDPGIGHFGLALDDYAHFTSPIRRYPDLLVHRAIKHWLRQGSQHDDEYDLATMTSLSENCMRSERRAEEATRDATDWLKCEFLQKQIGRQYHGTVSGVTSFGLFVQLDTLLIDGLVHVTSLKRDYYHFDPKHQRLVGEQTHSSYQLGDRLEIEVVRVDMEGRKIDFNLVSARSADGLDHPRKKAARKKKTNKPKTAVKAATKPDKKARKNNSGKSPQKH